MCYPAQGVGLPAIAIKTRRVCRTDLEHARKATGSLGISIDCRESGQQLLFLDLRERKVPPACGLSDRASFIECAKRMYTEHCEELKHTSNSVECHYSYDPMTCGTCPPLRRKPNASLFHPCSAIMYQVSAPRALLSCCVLT